MIRVAVIDRHPAARAGVTAILRSAPGVTPAGAAADARELWPLLHRTRPDVVLVDHHPRSAAGLALCLRIRSRLLGPRVVICADDPGPGVIVPAILAGAGGIVDKAAEPRELLHVIRAVAGGEHVMPRVTPRLQTDAARSLDPQDRAILAMRLADTAPSDISKVVGIDPRALAARIEAIVARLVPAGAAA